MYLAFSCISRICWTRAGDFSYFHLLKESQYINGAAHTLKTSLMYHLLLTACSNTIQIYLSNASKTFIPPSCFPKEKKGMKKKELQETFSCCLRVPRQLFDRSSVYVREK